MTLKELEENGYVGPSFSEPRRKKIVSYALFGENTRYAQFLPAVLRAHHAIFPRSEGWEMRVHLDNHARNTSYGKLLGFVENAKLVSLRWMGEAPLCRAMMWRLAPLWEDDTEVVFCRDIDALPTPRDRECMEAFISAEADAWVHTIHDHAMHDGIMGGLSGFRRKAKCVASSLDELCALAGNVDWAKHGTDQDVLNRFFQVPLFEHHWRAPRNTRLAVVSVPVPSRNESDPRDRLVAHLGASGFDVTAACNYYDLEAFRAPESQFAREVTAIALAETLAGTP